MTEKRIWIGLTGGFGTGKSTVAEIFRELGAAVFDADEMARGCLQPGREEYQKVIEQYGEKILGPEGQIDRKALAAAVFADPRLLAGLNRIIHPGVIREMKGRLDSSRDTVTVAVIPLLFEVGMQDDFDYIVTVAASGETVRERTVVSRGMTVPEIEIRQAAQMPLETKIRRADFVIDNNGSPAETRRQVEELWTNLTGYAGS